MDGNLRSCGNTRCRRLFDTRPDKRRRYCSEQCRRQVCNKRFYQAHKDTLKAEANLGLVWSIVRKHSKCARYHPTTAEGWGDQTLCDCYELVSVGTVGLLQAVEKFDPTKGVKFGTYAYPWIEGEIHRYYRDKGDVLGMNEPRRLHDAKKTIRETRERLTHEMGREPTDGEILDAAGLQANATG